MKLKKGVILQEMGNTFVAYDNEHSTLHELNETAYLILRGIKNNENREKIIKKLIKEFGISRLQVKKDYDSFVQSLKDKKLLVDGG